MIRRLLHHKLFPEAPTTAEDAIEVGETGSHLLLLAAEPLILMTMGTLEGDPEEIKNALLSITALAVLDVALTDKTISRGFQHNLRLAHAEQLDDLTREALVYIYLTIRPDQMHDISIAATDRYLKGVY